MNPSRSLSVRILQSLVVLATGSFVQAQELPTSGVSGTDFVYATSGDGSQSALFGLNVHRSPDPFQVGDAVSSVPSRWAHRRRTLGALETALVSPERGVFVTPMGDAAGNGALHLVDLRGGTTSSTLVPTGNPAGYDLAFLPDLGMVFSAEDDGAGNTVLRGFSYAVPGTLQPLNPASLTLAGSPAANVNRMGVDAAAQELHVPTATGIHVVSVQAGAPQVAAAAFVSTAPASPATNPASITHGGQTLWISGTSTFEIPSPTQPIAAGWVAWDSAGASESDTYGSVPTVPGKEWVPAAGATELAVVGDGTDTYAYFLLREPPPGTFFIKPSAIGVTRFIGTDPAETSTILMPDEVGEPFAIPSVHGTRVAFESSFGPPFIGDPAGGGEKISILYTPLDPLGSASTDGVLGVPAPLGGRVSTKGMDRPIWSRDGSRVMAATSHFPGAPNPGQPGIEVLNVPADLVLDEFSGPQTIVENLPFPNQSIVFPSAFHPRDPGQATVLDGLTFFGNAFHGGLASIAAPSWGAIGQLQEEPGGFTQSPNVPNFRALLPATFADATGSIVPVPGTFGARRTSFNLAAPLGLTGLTMAAAFGDELVTQLTGVGVLAELGLTPPAAPVRSPLPAGWVTTTEILSY